MGIMEKKMETTVQGLGVSGLGFWGFRIWDSGLGFMVQGVGFRVYCSGVSGNPARFRTQGPLHAGPHNKKK